MKQTTTLMKEMKSIIKKNVNEHLINLLKTMKSRNEKSISDVDVKLNDLTEIMKKMTINVDKLIYLNRVVTTSIEVHTIRLKKDAN
jgi:site-specific DNA-adenine methylase